MSTTTTTTDLTTEVEVEGDVMAVLHVEESFDSASSTTTVNRTLLALCTKEDMSIPIAEDNEDFNPAYQKRTRRIQTTSTIDIELSTALAADLSALSLLGIVDSNGKFIEGGDAGRKLLETPGDDTTSDEYLEVAYFSGEPGDWATIDIEAESEILHRFVNVEITNPEFDPSSTPPLVSMVCWVHGDYYVNYSSDGGGT